MPVDALVHSHSEFMGVTINRESRVASLNLPLGSYVVFAKVQAEATPEDVEHPAGGLGISVKLVAHAGGPPFDDQAEAAMGGFGTLGFSATLSLVLPVDVVTDSDSPTAKGGGRVELLARGEGGISAIRIVALPVDSLTEV